MDFLVEGIAQNLKKYPHDFLSSEGVFQNRTNQAAIVETTSSCNLSIISLKFCISVQWKYLFYTSL